MRIVSALAIAVMIFASRVAAEDSLPKISVGVGLVSLDTAKATAQKDDIPVHIPANLKAGLWVVEVKEGGTFDKAGVQKSDIITRIGSSPMKDTDSFEKWMATGKVGESYKVTLMRMNVDNGEWTWKTVTIKPIAAAPLKVAATAPVADVPKVGSVENNQPPVKKSDSSTHLNDKAASITVTYDKFKDNTTIKLSPISMPWVTGEDSKGDWYSSMLATIDGKPDGGAKPDSIGLWFDIGRRIDSEQLIFLADDERVKLTRVSQHLTDDGEDQFILFSVTPDQYIKLANAKKLEGQMGTYEFTLDDKLKSQMQLMAKQVGITK